MSVVAQGDVMKIIQHGIAYDLGTSIRICGDGREDGTAGFDLYKNKHGAYFTVLWDDHGSHVFTTFTPLLTEAAREICERLANALVEKHFGPQPEFGSPEITAAPPGHLFH
jgi:hypothetical protein